MSHLSVATIIEKDRISSEYAFVSLMKIHVINPSTLDDVETLYVARNSEDITFQGDVYQAGAYEVDVKREAGALPNISVNVVDYTRAIQGRMQEYGGGVGFGVDILVVNSGNLNQPPEMNEHFTVVGARSQTYSVEFSLGAENPLTRRFPFRYQFRDRCQWLYKGAECGYTGALPTCDYSLDGPNGCGAHNNVERFGAFPGIKPTSS